jgi:hypothetical protein
MISGGEIKGGELLKIYGGISLLVNYTLAHVVIECFLSVIKL